MRIRLSMLLTVTVLVLAALGVALHVYRRATQHLTPQWSSFRQSHGALHQLKVYAMEVSRHRSDAATFDSFAQKVRAHRSADLSPPAPGNPLPGILPANHTYGFTRYLPVGMDAGEVPLLWDLEGSPDGFAAVLFWSGRVAGERDASVGDLGQIVDPLSKKGIAVGGVPGREATEFRR